MNEKLDPFSKILLATQTINFLANNINGVMLDVEFLSRVHPDDSLFQQSSRTKREQLEKAVTALHQIMEDLGDYCSNVDICSPIDIRITEDAFDILQGNDSVEQETDVTS